MEILHAINLKKYYGQDHNLVKALDGINLTIEKGEFLAIVGTSGTGKSTLLNMLGGLDYATEGEVIINGERIFDLSEEELTIFRRKNIGFIFQNFNLVPILNVYENIILPIELDQGVVDKEYINQIIRALGIESKLDNLPSNLSGGQQQRVAIGRALASKPAFILANEISVDTVTLDLLGIPHKVGEKVTLEYDIKGEKRKSEFILSGFWESDPAINVGVILVSKAFVDNHKDILVNTYKQNFKQEGSINAYIMFKDTNNLEGKLQQVIEESGYIYARDKISQADDVIHCNVNWAYLGGNTSQDNSMILVVFTVLVLLIMLVGYLVIYNIFQISVMKDIRFYGLLKTIGASANQIKEIINKQALIISCIGIPVGIIIGKLIESVVFPMIIQLLGFTNTQGVTHIGIFIYSAIFTWVTVFISTNKPGKFAGAVSPIEALRYRGEVESNDKLKHSTDGGKLYKMAFSNLTRHRNRTRMVILSMSLGIIMLNTSFTIVSSMDISKSVSRFSKYDFLIGHAKYFNADYSEKLEVVLSDTFIEAVKQQDIFKEGGKLYCNYYNEESSIDYDVTNSVNQEGIYYADNDEVSIQLFGLDDLFIPELKVLEGTIDIEKLKSGKYILEGVQEDDYQMPMMETSHYKVGDLVKVTVDGVTYQYEVMAKIQINAYTLGTRTFEPFSMYLPSEEFLRIVTRPTIISYSFNVEEGQIDQMETFLKDYIRFKAPDMGYECKKTYIDEFKEMQNLVIVIGGILTAIIGLIAILNFINLIVTSFLARQQEFTIMESIGMTKKQLKRMLYYEGIYYAVLTIGVSVILSTVISILLIGKCIGKLWFFSYKFTLVPIGIICPLLFIVTWIVPYLAYRRCGNKSIVERLREV